MAMEVIRGRAHGAYTRTPARWAALVLCLCPALGARIRSVASVPGVRPVARCSAFACTSLSEQHSPAARASKHSLAGVEETPEQLREIIHALFGSESSKRAFSRDMIAKQSAKRDYPDEMGNRFTYGEFDLAFFLALLKLAQPRQGEIFCDLGSGCGRLVCAAALAGYQWREAIGIELLDDLHKLGTSTLATLENIAANSDELALRPCRLLAGDGNVLIRELVAEDESKAAWTLFAYSTCMPSVGPYLCELSASLGAALPIGSRVITTDKMLVSDDHGRFAFKLLAQLDAPNYNTYSSTGYVYELVSKEPASETSAPAAEAALGGGGEGPRGAGGILRPPGSPMVSRRAIFHAALVAAPLALARRARADEPAQPVPAARAPGAPALPESSSPASAPDSVREVSFSARSLGLGLADVPVGKGSRVAVSRVLDGSEAARKGLVAGLFLTSVGGQQLPPTARAADVRKLLADAPRPITLAFQGALPADLAVELAAKSKGAETERFKIDRTREPAANCGIRSRKGDTIEIEYEARLADESNRVIDSSFMRGIGAPYALQLGNGDVPRALELGIYDMCIGEARRIVAPPRLAYGVAGNRQMGVPPNATVVWDVSMAAINFQSDPATKREDTGMALTPWEASAWENQQ